MDRERGFIPGVFNSQRSCLSLVQSLTIYFDDAFQETPCVLTKRFLPGVFNTDGIPPWSTTSIIINPPTQKLSPSSEILTAFDSSILVQPMY